jgi:hypothetical protein
MGQGILDQVEHLAVEFGVGAVHLQFDLLVEFAGQVAHDPGSFCQALPIGCIRVFITPSCSSAVTFDSRCSGTSNSVSSLRLGDLQQLIARQNQFRHHRHQMFQRVHIDADRLVGDLSASSTSTSTTDLAAAGFSRGNDRRGVLLGAGGRRRQRRSDLGCGLAERAPAHPAILRRDAVRVRVSGGDNTSSLTATGSEAVERLHAQLDQWIDQILIGALRLRFGGLKP